LKIAYESSGSGDPAVVFVHGIFGNRSYFASQVECLAGSHRVIALDLRGHGESDMPQAVSVEDFADDVVAVLEDAAIAPVVLCGHSMAAGVALDVAARRPELVRGLVMLDAVMFFPDEVRRGAAEGLLPRLAGPAWSGALRDYLGRLIEPASPAVTARVIGDLTLARREIAQSFFDSLFGSAYVARQQRYADALAGLRCPLMYVRAKSPVDVQRIQSLKPDTMLGQVVGSGHYLTLSAADQVNAMLDRFLAATSQRP
jgi:pimeloyl-ACP methyl ester carboxylesterase